MLTSAAQEPQRRGPATKGSSPSLSFSISPVSVIGVSLPPCSSSSAPHCLPPLGTFPSSHAWHTKLFFPSAVYLLFIHIYIPASCPLGHLANPRAGATKTSTPRGERAKIKPWPDGPVQLATTAGFEPCLKTCRSIQMLMAWSMSSLSTGGLNKQINGHKGVCNGSGG